MALCWTLDKLGPMCRTADDCGLVLAAIAGRDPLRPDHGRRVQLPPARRGRTRARPPLPHRRGEERDGGRGAGGRVQLRALARRAVARIASDRGRRALPRVPYGPTVGIIVDAEGAAPPSAISSKAGAPGSFGRRPTARRAGHDHDPGRRLPAGPAPARTHARRGRRSPFPVRRARVPPPAAGPLRPLATTSTRRAPRREPRPRRRPPRCPARARYCPGGKPGGRAGGRPFRTAWGKNNLPTSLQFLGRAYSEGTLLALADRYQSLDRVAQGAAAGDALRPSSSY